MSRPVDIDTYHLAVRTGTDEAAYGTARHPLACSHESVHTLQRTWGPGDEGQESGACADCSAVVVRHYRGDGAASDPNAGWGPWKLTGVTA